MYACDHRCEEPGQRSCNETQLSAVAAAAAASFSSSFFTLHLHMLSVFPLLSSRNAIKEASVHCLLLLKLLSGEPNTVSPKHSHMIRIVHWAINPKCLCIERLNQMHRRRGENGAEGQRKAQAGQKSARRVGILTLISAILAVLLANLQERESADEKHARLSWPPAEQLGPSGWSERMSFTPCNVSLHAYFWPAPNASARIVLLHGHGAYAIFDFLKSAGAGRAHTYAGSWVEAMNQRGISVAALDHAGHGRSDGARRLRGYVERFEHHVQNTLGMLSALDDAENSRTHKWPGFENDKPLFLLGESMGGHVALLAAEQAQKVHASFRGTVLLAPMLSLEKVKMYGINRLLVSVGKQVSEHLPTLKLVSSPTQPLGEEQLAEFRADPLNLYDTLVRARVAYEYLDACSRLAEEGGMEKFTVPFTVLHSSKDELIEPEGSYALYRRAVSSDKSFIDATHLAPGMKHLVTKEEGNEHILEHVLTWINARI